MDVSTYVCACLGLSRYVCICVCVCLSVCMSECLSVCGPCVGLRFGQLWSSVEE